MVYHPSCCARFHFLTQPLLKLRFEHDYIRVERWFTLLGRRSQTNGILRITSKLPKHRAELSLDMVYRVYLGGSR